MKNFTFRNEEVKLGSYLNAKGKEVVTVEINSSRIHSFRKDNLDNEDSFIEDVVFSLRDSANRYSKFNKKSDCIEFANLLIENVK